MYSSFLMPKISVKFEWGHAPATGRQIKVGQVLIGDFRPISRYISETAQHKDTVTMER